MELEFVKEFNKAWYSVGLKIRTLEIDNGQVRYCIKREKEIPNDSFNYITPTTLELIIDLAKKYGYSIGVDFSSQCLSIFLNNK